MDNKGILIICITLIIVVAIILGAIVLISGNNSIDLAHANNTSSGNDLNLSKNSSDVKNATAVSNKSTTSSQKVYGDWQNDYETGEYDEFGSPIYRSVFSTSGGQYDPGIYEAYWSENGPINETRIG
ncbi:hypothetical protein [uncultured Methanobrevibacter sp.]|uniref:hypothetical protein n=1 Tax=uncultured Methanobrevibacter sp. TaxID=253161 RepID=UPI00262F6E4B